MSVDPAEFYRMRGLWAAVIVEVIADYRQQIRRMPGKRDHILGNARRYWSGWDGVTVLASAGYDADARLVELLVAASADTSAKRRPAVGRAA